MFGESSRAAIVAMVLMALALAAQVFSSLLFWFFLTRGDVMFLGLAMAFGGGVAGILGLPFVAAAVFFAGNGRLRTAGVLAMVGGPASAVSLLAIAAGLFALFSPEARVAASTTGAMTPEPV